MRLSQGSRHPGSWTAGSSQSSSCQCSPRASVPRLAVPAPGPAALGPQVSAGDRPMAERGELDLTGAKQNTGVWLVKVRFACLPLALLLK